MRHRLLIISLTLLVIGGNLTIAQAQQPATSVRQAPMLEEMNRQTQALFESVKPGLVQVQLPVPKWMTQLNEQDNPLDKWNLDPQVREKLRDERARILSGQVGTYITPSTQPQPGQGEMPDATQQSPEQRRWQMTVVQRPDGGIEFVAPGAAPYDAVVGAMAAPRTIGIVFDDAGHVVIPVYVDKEAFDEQHSLTVSGFGGGASEASFVGSDRQTNLTVVKLEHPLGKPAQFSGSRPPDGSLILMLSAGGESGKLSLWTRGQQERGLVVTVDGNVAGFARLGQFLDAELARPVIGQLIQFGKVRRATLGVAVTEAVAPDGRRAVHVNRVLPGSPAAAAGIQENDFILTLAGAPVDDLPNFAAAISSRDGVTGMQILRNGDVLDIKVELRPK